MRILLTHSYFLQLDPKQVAHAQPYPPLATLLAAACLRNEGHEVRVFDTMFRSDPEEITAVIKEFAPDMVVVYDDSFNYLTKMCLSNMREAAFRMQELAHEAGCRVVVSSSDAADHYTEYLRKNADAVIIGEGEHTLIELATAYQSNSTLSGIPGLAFVQDGEVRRTPPRKVSRDLDAFPLPAWDLIDITLYRRVWESRHGYFSINVATTRGCPYKCNWCAKPVYGNSYNMRSPENVVSELLLLKRLFDMDHIWFCDDIFGLKRSWVTRFAELVRQHDLRLRFKIQSRADLLVQERYVEDLRAAGCEEVWMGAESGSQKVLDAMDKGTTVEEIREARSLLRRHGIRAAFFLQFGYPGENDDDIRKTIELVRENMPDDIGISVSYPLPGTKFYENVRRELGSKTNWTDSDDLAMMFSSPYPPQYYKTLHRLVHSTYRGSKAITQLREQGLRTSPRNGWRMVKYSLSSALLRWQLQRILRNERAAGQ